MSNVEITFRPLDGGWVSDGKETYDNCRFRASYSKTISDLKHELSRLGVRECVIELDLQESDIRLDGLPRATARPDQPPVRLSFHHPDIGPLQYPCDTYDNWKDNVRAIAKTLEAQRAQERYGATRRHQQYAGWQQLPPGGSAVVQTAMTVEQAASFLNRAAGSPTSDRDLMTVAANAQLAYRRAAANLHPDRGGDAQQFTQLQEANRVLDQHHSEGVSV